MLFLIVTHHRFSCLPTLFDFLGVCSGADQWGNRFATLNIGSTGCPATASNTCRATYRQGRLVRSGTQGSLTLAAYDVYEGFNLALTKREPTMVELFYTGYFNVSTPCLAPKVPPNYQTNDIYYCNGFDNNEVPMAIATDGIGSYYLAGQEEPTSTNGIRQFNGAQGLGRNLNSINLNDRNVSPPAAEQLHPNCLLMF